MKKLLVPAIAIVLVISSYADDSILELVKTGTPVQVRAVIRGGADVNAEGENGAPIPWLGSSR